MRRFFAMLSLACAGLAAQSDLLWDNNVVPVGYGTRAISPPGFPNIRVSSTGWFSLDGGNTWMPEGSGYHKAFRIEGDLVLEPSTILAIGAGLVALAARRRRK